jgi:hypothetical protein
MRPDCPAPGSPPGCTRPAHRTASGAAAASPSGPVPGGHASPGGDPPRLPGGPRLPTAAAAPTPPGAKCLTPACTSSPPSPEAVSCATFATTQNAASTPARSPGPSSAPASLPGNRETACLQRSARRRRDWLTPSVRRRALASAHVAGRSWIPGEPPESNGLVRSCGPISAADGSLFGSHDREADASATCFLSAARYRLHAWQNRADRQCRPE